MVLCFFTQCNIYTVFLYISQFLEKLILLSSSFFMRPLPLQISRFTAFSKFCFSASALCQITALAPAPASHIRLLLWRQLLTPDILIPSIRYSFAMRNANSAGSMYTTEAA